MLSRQELLDIWHDEYGEDTLCPFVDERGISKRSEQVLWRADISALDIYPVQAWVDVGRELAWIPDLKQWFVVGVAVYTTREEAAAKIYEVLAAEFHRLVDAKERIDGRVKR